MLRFRVGLKRHAWQLAGWFLLAFGAIWLPLEPLLFYWPWLRTVADGNMHFFYISVVFASLAAAFRAIEPRSVAFALPTHNTSIEIRFGDLFGHDGHLLIPVNEFFDGHLGPIVDSKTVHGQFIQKYCDLDKDAFEEMCDSQLSQVKGSLAKQRTNPRMKFYPIGTTVCVPIGSAKAFLFALSKTDRKTAKASADVSQMLRALNGLWKAVRADSNGHAVFMPLVGAGQSGIGLESQHLLRLILVSLLEATREAPVTARVVIVLMEDQFERIDIRAIKKEWS